MKKVFLVVATALALAACGTTTKTVTKTAPVVTTTKTVPDIPTQTTPTTPATPGVWNPAYQAAFLNGCERTSSHASCECSLSVLERSGKSIQYFAAELRAGTFKSDPIFLRAVATCVGK